MNKKIEADTLVICPDCKASVKQKNLEYHVRHVHNKKIDEIITKSLENSYNKIQENKTKKVTSKIILTIIIIICIIVAVSISVYFLSNFKDSNSQNNNKNYLVSIQGKGGYPSIQAAINSASDYDTIFVKNGTYFENIIIGKSISIIGEDKNSTFINGDGLGTIIYIRADNVKISGFSIINAGLTSLDSDVRDAAGIKIESSYNTISYCNISSNLNYGIYLYANPKNTNNMIKFNNFDNNRVGICAGNVILSNISSNSFTGNKDYGLYFEDKSNENMISDNIFTENNYGIRIKGSEKNTVINNLIMNNIFGLYFCCGSKNNTAYNNNFMNNTDWNADETLNNFWDNGIIGNYWDDYKGADIDGDGIGDTPYLIYNDNGDKFPLMQQNIKNNLILIEGKGHYSSIQEAIDAASNNDTIYVSKGTYFENIFMKKPVSMIGEDKNTTIIDGKGSGTVIQIAVDYVKISGFTITNSGINFDNKDAGIKASSKNNIISDCIISSNKQIGLYLGSTTKNTNNIIKYNNFYNNSYGIYAESNKLNNISSNTFTSNIIYGIYLTSSSNNNMIFNNKFLENHYAIRIKGSEKNTVIKNLIMKNRYGLYFCCGAENNLVYKNNFINNANWDTQTNSISNIFDNGKVGNYWDNYTGIDANADGIGDTPYIILDYNNFGDRFPLMKPP